MESIASFYGFVTDGVPSYSKTFHDIKWAAEYCLENCAVDSEDDYSPSSFIRNLKRYGSIGFQDYAVILGFAVLWTVLRYALSSIVFGPLARWTKLRLVDAKKFPESAWKFLIYTCAWSFTCYVIFGLPQYNHLYYDPDSLWDDFVPGMTVEPIVYYLYMMQLSFYIHSIYGTLFMDAWRKDSPLMMFHHFLTISLIGFSYAARYHKVGLLVLFVHDATDICLEFTKCNVYFKNRGGKFYLSNEIISTIGFICFTLSWYLFRLYWLPLKILHSSGYGAMVKHSRDQTLPFFFFFNGMLWILQLMNIYWFTFIIIFLVKVVTGQIKEIDDIREEEVLQEKERQRLAKSNGQKVRTSPRNKPKKVD